jgi:ATP-dependent helicase/nuclease subunit B
VSERCFAPGAPFWHSLAAAILASVPPGADAGGVTVLLPALAVAPPLRRELAMQAGGPLLAPRITTLARWLLADAAQTVRRPAELYEALSASAWARARFGAPRSLWALARDLAALFEEFDLAEASGGGPFAARLREAVRRHHGPAGVALGEEVSELILRLWTAQGRAERASQGLQAAWQARCADPAGPLFWVLPHGAGPQERALAARYAQATGSGVSLVTPDRAALLAREPWIGAAWPEMTGPPPQEPPVLADRAAPDFATAGGAGLVLHACTTLEEQAAVAARWVRGRLAGDGADIALVALDRRAARRLRALLEREGVAVRDETGWRLSTTRAAASLMHGLALLAGEPRPDALLDWLGSPFVRGQEDPAAAECIEDVLRGRHAPRGWRALEAALAHLATHPGGPLAGSVAALARVQRLRALAPAWQQAVGLDQRLAQCEAFIDAVPMRGLLQADPVGAHLLQTLAELGRHAQGLTVRLGGRDFLDWLEQELEDAPALLVAHASAQVRLLTLAATRLRSFDAVYLLGAGQDQLPGKHQPLPLLGEALRADLGLRTRAGLQGEAAWDLAHLLTQGADVAGSWRCLERDEPRALSPSLLRLDMLREASGGRSAVRPVQAADIDTRQVQGEAQPAPLARAAGHLPARLAAGAWQDLVDCPYRYFARTVLGLAVREAVERPPDAREQGTLLHRILLAYHAGGGGGAAALRAVLDAEFRPALARHPTLLLARERLRRLLPDYLAWQQKSEAAGWRWRMGELALRGELDGIRLVGRLDRLDQHVDGRWRVVDYKSGDPAALAKRLKSPGEDVQLAFYGLLLACGSPPGSVGKGEREGERQEIPEDIPVPGREPDATLYLALRPPGTGKNRKAALRALGPRRPVDGEVRTLAAQIQRETGRIAAGEALPAMGIEAVCGFCELRSLCRLGHAPHPAPALAGPAPGSADGAAAPTGAAEATGTAWRDQAGAGA